MSRINDNRNHTVMEDYHLARIEALRDHIKRIERELTNSLIENKMLRMRLHEATVLTKN
jgi:hypothetical protein